MNIPVEEFASLAVTTMKVNALLLQISDALRREQSEIAHGLVSQARVANWNHQQRLLRLGSGSPADSRMAELRAKSGEEDPRNFPSEEFIPVHLLSTSAAKRYAAAIRAAAGACAAMERERHIEDGLAEVLGDCADIAETEISGQKSTAKDQTLEDLNKFISKVDLLRGLSLSLMLSGEGFYPDIAQHGSGTEVIDGAPDPEAFHAFLLTFQMFTQDSDHVSIRRVGDTLDGEPRISPAIKYEFKFVRKELDQYLDHNFDSDEFESMGITTPRKLLDIFLNGEFARTDDDKQKQYQQWKTAPFFSLIEFVFVTAIGDFMMRLTELHDIVQQALREMTVRQVEQ